MQGASLNDRLINTYAIYVDSAVNQIENIIKTNMLTTDKKDSSCLEVDLLDTEESTEELDVYKAFYFNKRAIYSLINPEEVNKKLRVVAEGVKNGDSNCINIRNKYNEYLNSVVQGIVDDYKKGQCYILKCIAKIDDLKSDGPEELVKSTIIHTIAFRNFLAACSAIDRIKHEAASTGKSG